MLSTGVVRPLHSLCFFSLFVCQNCPHFSTKGVVIEILESIKILHMGGKH